MLRPNTTHSALQSNVKAAAFDPEPERILISSLRLLCAHRSFTESAGPIPPSKRAFRSSVLMPRLRPRLLRERDIVSAHSARDEPDEHQREGRA
jgi:hypothetical protein